MIVFSTFPIIFIVATIIIISRFIRHNSRTHLPQIQQPTYQANQLTVKEKYVATLIIEQHIYNVPELIIKSKCSELEVYRMVNKLITQGVLSGFYINYRTKTIDQHVPVGQRRSEYKVDDFKSGYYKCQSCGASTYVHTSKDPCQYCGSPIIIKQ